MHKTTAGFGLVELLVAVGIMVLVMSIILADYGSFNSAVLLRNQAFEIALDTREAQLLAVSTAGPQNEFRDAFGIYFASSSAASNDYFIFRDDNGNDMFDKSSADEFIEVELINSRFEIRDIIAKPSDDSLDDVSITFTRPNFDAEFASQGSSIPAGTDAIVIGVSVLGGVGTGPDEYREVLITSTGQISVQ